MTPFLQFFYAWLCALPILALLLGGTLAFFGIITVLLGLCGWVWTDNLLCWFDGVDEWLLGIVVLLAYAGIILTYANKASTTPSPWFYLGAIAGLAAWGSLAIKHRNF